MAIGVLMLMISMVFAICRLLYKLQYPDNHKHMHKLVRKFGPTPFPIVGIWGPTGMKESRLFLHDLETTYGSPLFLKAGPVYVLILFDADNVEVTLFIAAKDYIALTNTSNLRKNFAYQFLHPWFGKGLLTSYGQEWHRQRKLLTPSFHFRILNDFVPIMNDAAIKLIKVMRQKTINQNGRPWNICQTITMCTLDIIMETSMGHKINAQDDPDCEYAKAIYEFSECLTHRIAKPWLWLDPVFAVTVYGTRYARATDTLKCYSLNVIEQRRCTYQTGKQSNDDEKDTQRLALLDHLLKLESDGLMNSEQVREQVDTFMFEGHDTTSHGLMWALFCLAKNPEIQEEIRRETIEVLESGDFVAEGTELAIDVYQLHRDERFFPDPDKFDPTRFLASRTTGRHPFAYCPFAGGPRNCIGQRFALNELRVLLCHLIRNFEFCTTQTLDQTGFVYQMILHPMDGIWLTTKEINICDTPRTPRQTEYF